MFWLSRCALIVLSLNCVKCMEFNYCQISPSHTLCQYAVSCLKTDTHDVKSCLIILSLDSFDKYHVSSDIKFYNIMILSRDSEEHALLP